VTSCIEGVFSQKKEFNMKKFSLLMLVALFLMISTLGCNATRGAGTDIKNAGQHIENIGK